jgi:hypothetical protein
MQFVKNGPDVPDRLLQAHEEGKVVFFCGAGISYPARLPGFSGLVEKLYERLGVTPSAVEQAAIKAGQFDTAISLLERNVPGERAVVRKELEKILRPDLSVKNATATHEALLTLARSREDRYRLITTNFDRIFEEVVVRKKLHLKTYQAPLLPVPKNRWDGLVYLHGLLTEVPTDSELDTLVVSSGDFGLAYLTERWAARFVGELFRGYIVCFVGYSINDPVLRYMMDALAADQLLGESPPEFFAFGSYSKGKKDSAAEEWGAKNVTPILYREFRRHAFLHKTLRQWAGTYRDGALGRERIVMQHAATKPMASTKQDDFVGRVLWALSDKGALPAKRFADFDPVPSLDWLEPLSDARFGQVDLTRFGVQPNQQLKGVPDFSITLRPTPYNLSSPMSLVQWSRTCANSLDPAMLELGRWLSRHLHDPDLLLWIANNGGVLHWEFSRLIEHELSRNPPSTSMQILWRLVISGRLWNKHPRYDLYDWCKRFKNEGLSPTLRMQLRELLAPCIQVSKVSTLLRGEDSDVNASDRPIKELVSWELMLRTDSVHSVLVETVGDEKWGNALPDLLSDFSTLLHDALELSRELGDADDKYDGSYWAQPSISKHPQNRDYSDWTALIDLTRDAWLETAKVSPERAKLEVLRWLSFPYPIFKRLTFFAATNTPIFSPKQSLEWLLADDFWWLWSSETLRETIRLLKSVVPELGTNDKEILELAILNGPPVEMFRDDIEQESLKQRSDRDIWLRLAKIDSVGVELGADAAQRFRVLSQENQAWKLSEDERDEFSTWMGDGSEWRTFLATPKRRNDLVLWLQEHPEEGVWKDDDWRERCERDFATTACALYALASGGEWIVKRWRVAFQAWSEGTRLTRSWRRLANVIENAPDNVIQELSHSISWWLQVVAKVIDQNEEGFFRLIRRILELNRVGEQGTDNDLVFRAINHPVGHVTDAALAWWYRQSLEDGQGLEGHLKTDFTDICNPDISGYRPGRVMLASNIITFFRVDQAWTEQHLLPLFDWQKSEMEALGAWAGFLRSPRLYRPLVDAFKAQFLETAKHYQALGPCGKQYVALLTFAALEPEDTFNNKELREATRSLPEDGLKEALQALGRAIEGAGEQRAEYWRNRAKPYLKRIWPKNRELITPSMSERFARVCIKANEEFPDAFEEISVWLTAIEYPDYVVHRLHLSGLCGRFPAETLNFLFRVIGDDTQRPPGDLEVCLTTIRQAQESLAEDRQFNWLVEYLRKHNQIMKTSC